MKKYDKFFESLNEYTYKFSIPLWITMDMEFVEGVFDDFDFHSAIDRLYNVYGLDLYYLNDNIENNYDDKDFYTEDEWIDMNIDDKFKLFRETEEWMSTITNLDHDGINYTKIKDEKTNNEILNVLNTKGFFISDSSIDKILEQKYTEIKPYSVGYYHYVVFEIKTKSKLSKKEISDILLEMKNVTDNMEPIDIELFDIIPYYIHLCDFIGNMEKEIELIK